MGKSFFTIEKKDIFYGQNCLESLYGDISTFANNAVTSKGINISGQTLFPLKYHILIQTNTNSILLKYTSGDNLVYTASVLALTWALPPTYYCKKNTYTMYLSGGNLTTTINKWLTQDQVFQSFTLSGGNFTGSIEFRQKSTTSTTADKLIWILSIDTRTQSIQRKICLNIATSWDCLERNK